MVKALFFIYLTQEIHGNKKVDFSQEKPTFIIMNLNNYLF